MTRRVVFDTSTAISALLWRGVSHILFLEMLRRSFFLPVFAGIGGCAFTPQIRPALRIAENVTPGNHPEIHGSDKACISCPHSRRHKKVLLSRIFYIRFESRTRPAQNRRKIDPKRIEQHFLTDDPTDNHVLACALAADADVIVSGDQHLLSLNAYEGVAIASAGDFLAQLTGRLHE